MDDCSPKELAIKQRRNVLSLHIQNEVEHVGENTETVFEVCRSNNGIHGVQMSIGPFGAEGTIRIGESLRRRDHKTEVKNSQYSDWY